MNCKRVRSLLPLFVGKDLSHGKISKVRIHLDRCGTCQKEYETYEVSLTKAKEWLSRERKEWDDNEWQDLLHEAVHESPPRVSPLSPWPFKKSWAYVLMVLLAIVLTLFVVRPVKVDLREGGGMIAASKASAAGVVRKTPQQVVSVTLVSRETGLKIAWFFNKDFNFEEEK